MSEIGSEVPEGTLSHAEVGHVVRIAHHAY